MCFVCRSEEDDGRLRRHGRVHHPFRVGHRSAGMLPAAWPHAVCSWATLPHGRYCESTHALLHTDKIQSLSIWVFISWRERTGCASRSMSCSNVTPVLQIWCGIGAVLTPHLSFLLTQERAASSPCARVWQESTLSCPASPATCTAFPRTLATATAGPCFVPGGAWVSPCWPASSAPWRPPWAHPLARRPTNRGRRTGPCDGDAATATDPRKAQPAPFEHWCLKLFPSVHHIHRPWHRHPPSSVHRAWRGAK